VIYLEPAGRLQPLQEVLRYLEHRNSAADQGYVRFLSRLGDPVRERLSPGERGLDFGCGPAAVLGELLTAHGFPTVSYDPLFRPDDACLAQTYDFVTCSEVIEHAHRPLELFAQLGRLVRPGGLIGVMTRFYGLEAPFGDWWYRRDPTHVCFYDARTMTWIADRMGWVLELPEPHIALYRAS
jgi:SAM-dependent methyltransferase